MLDVVVSFSHCFLSNALTINWHAKVKVKKAENRIDTLCITFVRGASDRLSKQVQKKSM